MEKENKIKSLNLKWLKENYSRLYYFGLSFIQLKIDETYRLHFYTKKLDYHTDSIHNHRYNFESTILKGQFINILYKIEEGSGYIIENESCTESIDALKLNKKCNVSLLNATTYKKGDKYKMYYKHFHQVESNDAITLLKRSEYKQDYAQVITKKDEISNCPFALKVSDETLWAIIEEMIND